MRCMCPVHPCDCRSDVWAMGIVIAFGLLHRMPYDVELCASPVTLMGAIVSGVRPEIPTEGPKVWQNRGLCECTGQARDWRRSCARSFRSEMC